jgi:hypothetical protein
MPGPSFVRLLLGASSSIDTLQSEHLCVSVGLHLPHRKGCGESAFSTRSMQVVTTGKDTPGFTAEQLLHWYSSRVDQVCHAILIGFVGCKPRLSGSQSQCQSCKTSLRVPLPRTLREFQDLHMRGNLSSESTATKHRIKETTQSRTILLESSMLTSFMPGRPHTWMYSKFAGHCSVRHVSVATCAFASSW